MARFGQFVSAATFEIVYGLGCDIAHTRAEANGGVLLWELADEAAGAEEFPNLVPGYTSEHRVNLIVERPAQDNLRLKMDWIRDEQSGEWNFEIARVGVDGVHTGWLATFYFADDDAAMRFKLTFA